MGVLSDVDGTGPALAGPAASVPAASATLAAAAQARQNIRDITDNPIDGRCFLNEPNGSRVTPSDEHSASIRTGCRVLLASAHPSSGEHGLVKIIETAGARGGIESRCDARSGRREPSRE